MSSSPSLLAFSRPPIGFTRLFRLRLRRMRSTISHVPNTKSANAAATSPARVDTESGPSLEAGDDGTASGDDCRRRRIRDRLELMGEPASAVQRL